MPRITYLSVHTTLQYAHHIIHSPLAKRLLSSLWSLRFSTLPWGREGIVGPIPFFHIMIRRAHVQASLCLVSRPSPRADTATDLNNRSGGRSIAQPPSSAHAQTLANCTILNTPLGPLGRVSAVPHRLRDNGGSGGRGDLCPSTRTPASTIAVTSQPGSSVLRDGASPLRQAIG